MITELGSTARPPGTYRPTRHLHGLGGAALGGVHGPHPVDRGLEGGADRGVELGQGPLERLRRHAQALGADPVEALGGVEHGRGSADGDVLHHGRDGARGGLDVERGARQYVPQGGGPEVPSAQVEDAEDGVGSGGGGRAVRGGGELVGHGHSLGAPGERTTGRPCGPAPPAHGAGAASDGACGAT